MHETTPVPAPAPSRRPIRARGSGWARRVSTSLVHAGVTPNAISIASVAFAATGGALLVLSADVPAIPAASMLAGAALCTLLRSLCNMFDGMVAIEGGRATPAGAVFNEFPDRVADALFFVGAGFAASALPWGERLGWLAATLAILTAYTRTLGAANGQGDDFGGPMAKPTRMAVLAIGCLAAAVELLAGREPVAIFAALAIICAGCVLTVALRLRRLLAKLELRA